MVFTRYIPVLTFAAALWVFTAPAKADLKVCNDTLKTIGVAIGYKADGQWISEGWWRVPAETCSSIIEGDLSSRYYYLHAEDASGRDRWLGRIFMCTSAKKFKITGLSDCFARGLERTGFFEIDTKDQMSWQVRLSNIEPGNTETTSTPQPTPSPEAGTPLATN